MSQLPDSYRVELDAYAGPLDLLLYLVRRHEIDLNDIPIARLTDQYLQHLKVIETIDVDTAGEFLVMAATLLEIKSQMIAPPPETPEGKDAGDSGSNGETSGNELPGGVDPRLELVQQLLAYKAYKDAAIDLEQRFDQWHQRHAISPAVVSKPDEQDNAEQADLELEDAHVMDLCQTFGRILDQIGQRGDHQVTYDDTPISLHAADIRDRLKRDGALTLQTLFEGRQHRSEMIGLFLAVLEMVRDRIVAVGHEETSGEIALSLRGDADQQQVDDEQRDWRDPETGEVQYDWPDEQSKKRAERRQRLRAKRAENRAVEDVLDDDDDLEAFLNEDEEFGDIDDEESDDFG